MEFFEKAHVAKDIPTNVKSHSTNEWVKKQLKQMLYGYKHGDNEIIKNSDAINDMNESDSVSVSGFSDLNITNTTNEAEDIQDITTFSAESGRISNIVDLGLNNSLGHQSHNKDIGKKHNRLLSEKNLVEDEESVSISDNNKDILSISEDENDSVSSEVSLSFIRSSTEIDFQKSGSSLNLPQKIATKVNCKNIEKRQIENDKCNSVDNEQLLGPYKRKMTKLMNIDEGYEVYAENTVIMDEAIPDNESISEKSTSTLDSFNTPIQFVSVTATEMPDQNLSDILGEYRHPTMRNLPSESHNVIISTNNSGIFSEGHLNLSNVHLETCDEVSNFETNEILDESDDKVLQDDHNESNIGIDESNAQVFETANYKTTLYNNTNNSILNASQASNYQNEIIVDDSWNSEQVEESCNFDRIHFKRKKETDNSVKVFNTKDSCILVLKHPIEIFIHGKVKVKVLSGIVEIFGFTLKADKFYNVFAPYCNYAQYLKTIENQNAYYYGLFGKLTSAGLTVTEAEDIVTSIGDQDGVIILKPLHTQCLDFIENNFSALDLFSRTAKYVDKCFEEASKILECSLYLTKPNKYFEHNIYWEQVLDSGIQNSSRGILCGAKGVGKSTSLRYLVNKLLVGGPVLVLDLDPGQCEFTVAGNISVTVVTEPLLGPNFTHLKTPEMTLNIGMISVMDNLRRYVAAVDELITYCSTKTNFRNMPWIINTMGLCNSLGQKIMSFIIIKSQPTYLLQLDSKFAKKRYERSLDALAIRKIYFKECQRDRLFNKIRFPDQLDYSFYLSFDTEPTTKFNVTLTSKDERYLNYLAYFGELIRIDCMSLLGITPYEVNLSDLKIGANVKIDNNVLLKVINGKILALCQYRGEEQKCQLYTLGDEPLLCHGHGLIRSVDVENQILYIITPTPMERLCLVNTLIYADWVPEIRGQEKYLPDGIDIPYRTSTIYQKRQLMFSPRRRFNPKQLLKMSKKS